MQNILMRIFMVMLCTLSSIETYSSDTNNLQKVAIITGASKGIGKAIAIAFAQEGYKIVLVSRTQSLLVDLAKQLVAQGSKDVEIMALDVSVARDMKKMAEHVFEKYQRIDVVVHNAGIYPISRIEDMTFEQWNQVIATNLNSCFYIVKYCLPFMKKSKSGRILFTSSISGPRVGLPGLSHYTASKAGMNGFMKTIAIELAKYHITVNAVEPGSIASEEFKKLSPDYQAKTIKSIPLGALGKPEDVANALVFLASSKANFITGQSIIIDGGQLLPESHYVDY